ncbi:hypothetical protein ACVISU_007246 [Bradyrhizobium sp. USDA 4452]
MITDFMRAGVANLSPRGRIGGLALRNGSRQPLGS